MKKEYKLQDGRTAVFEYDANGIGKITVEAMDCLIDMLPKWIPCSERLPDIHEEVLVCDQNGMQRVYVTTRISDDEIGWEDDYGFYQSLEDVQAWMPLPEPYKGEEE